MASTKAVTAIEASRLRKSYATGLFRRIRRAALEGLSLTVDRGEIFGYIGPNGSGKTTTLKLLMGLVFSDAGSATILGHPLTSDAWKHRVGYLPENPYFYDYLTPAEYLDYVGQLFGMPRPLRQGRTRELLERVGLQRSASVALRRFSKGMTQRVGLAQALMNDPDLVLLDEPMSGLDPLGRRLVRDLILELKERGKTVFFSTHILPDAESLCDRVGLLCSGRLAAVGRLDEILGMDVSHLEVLVTGVALDSLSEFRGLQGWRGLGERLRLQVGEGGLGQVVQAVETKGGRVLAVQPIRQSLEDYFFKELGSGADVHVWDQDA